MAKNLLLRSKTRADIDARVERVLCSLGNPEPPLRLDVVRELLKLDLGYFTADDAGMAREAVSRIRIATIQVLRRPTLIIDAIRKFSLKALYLPDRKRIFFGQRCPKVEASLERSARNWPQLVAMAPRNDAWRQQPDAVDGLHRSNRGRGELHCRAPAFSARPICRGSSIVDTSNRQCATIDRDLWKHPVDDYVALCGKRWRDATCSWHDELPSTSIPPATAQSGQAFHPVARVPSSLQPNERAGGVQ